MKLYEFARLPLGSIIYNIQDGSLWITDEYFPHPDHVCEDSKIRCGRLKIHEDDPAQYTYLSGHSAKNYDELDEQRITQCKNTHAALTYLMWRIIRLEQKQSE